MVLTLPFGKDYTAGLDTWKWCDFHNSHHHISLLYTLPCMTKNKEEMSKNANSGKGDIPASLVSMETALQDFYLEINDMVSRNAKKKGYHVEGEDNGRALYDFVDKYANGHSIGEIIYKAVRWARKRDVTDLVKIAAWAFLIWDRNRRNSISIDYKGRAFNSDESHGDIAIQEEVKCKNCNQIRSLHIDVGSGAQDDPIRTPCPIQKTYETQFWLS